MCLITHMCSPIVLKSVMGATGIGTFGENTRKETPVFSEKDRGRKYYNILCFSSLRFSFSVVLQS